MDLRLLLSNYRRYRVVESPPANEWLPLFGEPLKKDAVVAFQSDQYVPYDSATVLFFKEETSGEWMNWYFPDQRAAATLTAHLSPVAEYGSV